MIVAAVRTPIGKAKRGLLRDTQADDLLAPTLDALHARLRRHSMSPEQYTHLTSRVVPCRVSCGS